MGLFLRIFEDQPAIFLRIFFYAKICPSQSRRKAEANAEPKLKSTR